MGLLAGACDQMTGSSPGDVEGPPEVDSAALGYSHMPTGTSLPSPREVPLMNGIIGAEGETPRPKNDSPKTDSSGVESPYGCYLASRPYTDSTRIRSVYLYFPAEMVKAAERKTKSFVWQMSVAWGGGEADARYAHCVVPEASGAREAAIDQLLRAGEEDAAWGVADGGSESASAKGCIRIVYTITVVCVGGGGSFPEEHCKAKTESIMLCDSEDGGEEGGGDDGGIMADPWPGDGSGGGGGSGGSGGSEGDSEEGCTALNPEPGSDCKPDELDVDEKEVCPSDPLADMDIRATGCGENASVDGGRFQTDARPSHDGIDLLNDIGDPVKAMAGGTVERVGKDPDGWGNYVVIESSAVGNRYFLYAHLKSVEVGKGDSFAEGKQVGTTGISGNADDDCSGGPPHLHLEVREGSSQWYNAEPVDPESHLGTEFGANGKAISDSCS